MMLGTHSGVGRYTRRPECVPLLTTFVPSPRLQRAQQQAQQRRTSARFPMLPQISKGVLTELFKIANLQRSNLSGAKAHRGASGLAVDRAARVLSPSLASSGSQIHQQITNMTLIVYIRDLIVSLLSNLGFSVALTNLLANVSLIAIAF